jgi:hypothetical protein
MRCVSPGLMRVAALGGLGIDLRAQAWTGGRQVVEAAHERAVVEHRAADEERQPAARQDVLRHADRVFAPPAGRISLVRIDEVDEVVRNVHALGGGRLGRADVHVAVHERGIDRYDFNRQALCERQGEA